MNLVHHSANSHFILLNLSQRGRVTIRGSLPGATCYYQAVQNPCSWPWMFKRDPSYGRHTSLRQHYMSVTGKYQVLRLQFAGLNPYAISPWTFIMENPVPTGKTAGRYHTEAERWEDSLDGKFFVPTLLQMAAFLPGLLVLLNPWPRAIV